MEISSVSLELRFEGPDPTAHSVSARGFAEAVAGLQRAVYLLAFDAEDVDVRSNERASARIESEYELRIEAPQAGSVVAALWLGASTTLFPQVESVTDQLFMSMEAVSRGDAGALRRVMPDDSRRRKLLQEIRKVAPARGSQSAVTLRRRDRPDVGAIRLTEETQRSLRRLLGVSDPRTAPSTVTGELVKIDFEGRQVILRYPLTQRELTVQYEEGAEASLVESRRDYVQVTGVVTLYADGHPLRVNRVESLEPVDLSPIPLGEIKIDASRSVRFTDVILYPDLDETRQLYVVEGELVPGVPIHVYATTRGDLLDELQGEIALIYRYYVECPLEELADDAKALRSAFESRVEVVLR